MYFYKLFSGIDKSQEKKQNNPTIVQAALNTLKCTE